MTIDSDTRGERYTISKGTRGQATLCIDTMHLAPANYLIDIAVRSGDNYMLDYLPGIMSITVLPSNSTPPMFAMRTTGHGGVRYPCTTSIKTN